MSSMSSDARVALVTGASRGIGAAVIVELARLGITPVLAVRRPDSAQAAAAAVRALGIDPLVLGCHVENPAEARAAVAATLNRHGRLDILINNAGEIPSGPIESLDEKIWKRSYDVKLFGYMFLTRHLYARMKARGSGVILNDIGNSGENWDANYVAGSTANAALMAFTKALGGVSLDHGVRVLGVNPGPVDTQRMIKINKRRAIDVYGDESKWDSLHQHYPGQRAASAEEIADLMLFLCSPRAGYISGAIVTIDGGIAAKGSIIKPRFELK